MKKVFFAVLIIGIFCFCNISFAETKIWLTGSQNRIDFASDYIVTNSSVGKEEINSEIKKVVGSLNGRPWPGINISLFAPDAEENGIFVPISDNVLKRGTFCDDQDVQMVSILKNFEMSEQKKAKKSFQCAVKKPFEPDAQKSFQPALTISSCPCEGLESATLPLKLKSNYEGSSVILTFPRQKKIILFWIEDSVGKKVFLPDAEIIMTDKNQEGGDEINYPTLSFDSLTCTAVYIKWWDRVGGPQRGIVHKPEDVLLNNGIIVASVRDKNFGIQQPLIIPWKVLYSELKEEKKVKAYEAKSFIYVFNSATGVLEGTLSQTEDRLVEISTFDGQWNWQVVACQGNFKVTNVPIGEYFLQVFSFPVDDNKSRLKPKIEYEEVIFLE